MEKNVDGYKAGQPCTMSIGTDSYPGVVVRVTPKSVIVSGVETGHNKRQWPDQDFEIFLDKLTGGEHIYRKTTKGYRDGCSRLHVGSAYYHLDPSF